jgi:replicative DNA helicase
MTLFDSRKDMDKLIQEKDNIQIGMPTGISALDDAILGLGKNEVITIGGRTSMGKSSLARTILLNAGKPGSTAGVPVYSILESGHVEVIEYLAATIARVNWHEYRKGNHTGDDKSRLDSAMASLSTYSMLIEDNPYQTPDTIREMLSKISEKEPIACFIIDYIQLMSLRKPIENRQTEIEEISRELKCIAMEFHIPVISLSQLNRNVEYRENPRPRMVDIRNSGGPEQDSDKIILLHRQSYYDQQIDASIEDNGEAELIIAKARGGPKGTVKCGWIPEWTLFCDLPSSMEEF